MLIQFQVYFYMDAKSCSQLGRGLTVASDSRPGKGPKEGDVPFP